MANTVGNVVAGKPLVTGGVWIGPLEAPLPISIDEELDPAFIAAGYISEDGLTENADRSTDKIRAWGGDIVKVVQTEFSLTYEFTFIEALNAEVLKTVYGDDNVDSSTAGLQAVKVNSIMLPHKRFVFEIKDADLRIRVAVPDGQVTTLGEISYVDDNVVGYPVTLEGFQDTDGNNAYKYLTPDQAAMAS